MKITKYLIGSLICLAVLAACGPSGKNRKREPSRQSKKEKVEEKKSDDTVIVEEKSAAEERNNGDYKAPSTRKKGNSRLRRKGNGKPVPVPEEETIRDGSLNMARIEERVRLEQKIWEASTKENTEQFNKLKEQAAELAKKMTIEELDEAYKRIKNLKKMQ
ncbi:MAG: hypothetical protein IKT53_02585 [Bacteroidaceae bacterium]|nr:hypothetical protein [Bacteroidaceae bacterium]